MIDTKLIAAHQWVVDETQKKPGWWAEQAIMAATTFDIVRQVLKWESGWDAVWLLLCLIIATILVFTARNEVMLKNIGESRFARGFFLSLTVLNLFTLYGAKNLGLEILELLTAAFMLSYYCFAACENPRPKKRKEKLVLNVT